MLYWYCHPCSIKDHYPFFLQTGQYRPDKDHSKGDNNIVSFDDVEEQHLSNSEALFNTDNKPNIGGPTSIYKLWP